MDYYRKYLYYKKKYLSLKRQHGGLYEIRSRLMYNPLIITLIQDPDIPQPVYKICYCEFVQPLMIKIINDIILSKIRHNQDDELSFYDYYFSFFTSQSFVNSMILRNEYGYKSIYRKKFKFSEKSGKKYSFYCYCIEYDGGYYIIGNEFLNDDIIVVIDDDVIDSIDGVDGVDGVIDDDDKKIIFLKKMHNYITEFNNLINNYLDDRHKKIIGKYTFFSDEKVLLRHTALFDELRFINFMEKFRNDAIKPYDEQKLFFVNGYELIKPPDIINTENEDIIYYDCSMIDTKYKNKINLLRLFYTKCIKNSDYPLISVCTNDKKIQVGSKKLNDEIILFSPSRAPLKHQIMQFINSIKNKEKTDDGICKNNDRYLFKKAESSVGFGITELKHCDVTQNEIGVTIPIKTNEIVNFYEINDNKQNPIYTDITIDQIPVVIDSETNHVTRQFYAQSFYESPFNYKIDEIDTVIRCKLRFQWSPLLIKIPNGQIYKGFMLYNVPNFEFYSKNVLISNNPDIDDSDLKYVETIDDIRRNFSIFYNSAVGNKKLLDIFNSMIDTIDEDRLFRIISSYRYCSISHINGADIMMLGHENNINDFALLENNTPGVILGTQTEKRIITSTFIDTLESLYKKMLNSDYDLIKETINNWLIDIQKVII